MKQWIVIFFLSSLFSLHAYEFAADVKQGAYWQSFPLKMQIVIPMNDGGQLFQIVKECENEWENALGVDIWDISQAGPNDQNTIYWEDDFGNVTGYNPSQTLALTLRYQQGGLFSKVQIIINGSLQILRQNWSSMLKKTILHEMGHTIGLDHSTAPAIMQAYVGNFSHLEDDDIQGANAVIDQQRSRQATGYISPLSAEDAQKIMSCGTLSLTDDSSNNGQGPISLSFLFSLLMGILPLVVISKRGGKFFFPALQS